MKTFIAALLLTSLPIQAATITFEDGSQVEFPDDWIVSIDIVAEQPPVEECRESNADANAKARRCLLHPTDSDCPPAEDRTLRQRDLLTAPPASTNSDQNARQRGILGYPWD